LIKKAQLHVAISSRIAEQMVAIGIPPHRIRQIPNGIDIDRFTFDRTANLGDRRTFAYFGRLNEEKQPMMLLRCFAEILDNGARHRLVVAGDGPLLESMRRYVRDHRLEDCVEFLGRLDDVRALLSRSHFFVLPSKNEGLSNALLEAMSSGLVAIASAVSGSTDAIRHGVNGMLFAWDDDVALVRCLRTAAGMSLAEWQSMRCAARRDMEDRYVMADIAKVYADLYEAVEFDSEQPALLQKSR